LETKREIIHEASGSRTQVADTYNFAETLRLAAEGDKARAVVMVFPELGLSSYAIEDGHPAGRDRGLRRQGRPGFEQALPGLNRWRPAGA
jgi:hypothetical protein